MLNKQIPNFCKIQMFEKVIMHVIVDPVLPVCMRIAAEIIRLLIQ